MSLSLSLVAGEKSSERARLLEGVGEGGRKSRVKRGRPTAINQNPVTYCPVCYTPPLCTRAAAAAAGVSCRGRVRFARKNPLTQYRGVAGGRGGVVIFAFVDRYKIIYTITILRQVLYYLHFFRGRRIPPVGLGWAKVFEHGFSTYR